MTMWPHESTPLSEQEKHAYRYLLYQAMIDIRDLCQSRGARSYNPWKIWRQYCDSRVAGALADWLHNLAQHSITDFEQFDQSWFWHEYLGLCNRYPKIGANQWMNYRRRYDQYLNQEM